MAYCLIHFIRQKPKFKSNYMVSELGTLQWDTFNPNCLIRISNVDTYNFQLNPLFFGYSTEKPNTGFSKLDSLSRFCILFLYGKQVQDQVSLEIKQRQDQNNCAALRGVYRVCNCMQIKSTCVGNLFRGYCCAGADTGGRGDIRPP